MSRLRALTRAVSSELARGGFTHQPRVPIAVGRVGAGWLHLHSAATCLAADVLLVDRAGVDAALLSGFDL
jgi:hypothetical protein